MVCVHSSTPGSGTIMSENTVICGCNLVIYMDLTILVKD